MIKKTLAITLCIAGFILISCKSSNQKINKETMNTQELESIDQTMSELFEAICFKKGERPNMHKIVPLFVEKGILVNYNEEQPLIATASEFVELFEAQFEQGFITELVDKEIYSETKIYDRVAHRYSFYEARFKESDPEPFAFGVNSIQLIKIGDEWKITAMAWNDDNRGADFFKAVTGKEW